MGKILIMAMQQQCKTHGWFKVSEMSDPVQHRKAWTQAQRCCKIPAPLQGPLGDFQSPHLRLKGSWILMQESIPLPFPPHDSILWFSDSAHCCEAISTLTKISSCTAVTLHLTGRQLRLFVLYIQANLSGFCWGHNALPERFANFASIVVLLTGKACKKTSNNKKATVQQVWF